MEPVRGRHQGHARDRLRRHRHDADAGRGLRADRLRAGPHRAAVPRVRADAGRRGARLGLRGAHADADDVLQAAAGTTRAPAASSPPSSAASPPSSDGYRRYLVAAAAPAHPGRCRWRSRWPRSAGCSSTLLQVGAGAGRGPRPDPGAAAPGRRARRSPTPAATAHQAGDILAKVPEIESTAGHHRQPRGVALPGHRPAGGLGRAQALAAADQRRDQPAAAAHRRRAGLREQLRLVRPARRLAAGRVRDPDVGHLRAAARATST